MCCCVSGLLKEGDLPENIALIGKSADGTVEYDVPTMKMQEYSPDDISDNMEEFFFLEYNIRKGTYYLIYLFGEHLNNMFAKIFPNTY